LFFLTDGNLPRELNPFGDHLRPVSAAVMLSPPVRRSRVMEPERDSTGMTDSECIISLVKNNETAGC